MINGPRRHVRLKFYTCYADARRTTRLGVDPLGGASVAYWPRIIDEYGLAATVVDDVVDPRFAFMAADWDGKIRMDCSSPYAMTRLIGVRERVDIAFANDTDADRHGVVTRSGGLMPPNHFLAASIDYLFRNRPGWAATCGIGKTMVSSAMIDRVASRLGRPLVEVPVGFKWFVDGLLSGSLGFAGEESAGASLLRRDGSAWTTDKDACRHGVPVHPFLPLKPWPGRSIAVTRAPAANSPNRAITMSSSVTSAPCTRRTSTPAPACAHDTGAVPSRDRIPVSISIMRAEGLGRTLVPRLSSPRNNKGPARRLQPDLTIGVEEGASNSFSISG
jgi:hypothetical protein